MTEPLLTSVAPSLQWPAIPSLQHAMLMAMQFQLERSQWYSPADMRALQFQQARLLLSHAAQHVPYYTQTLRDLPKDQPMTEEIWQNIPILERKQVQEAGSLLESAVIPQEHQPVSKGMTSGSTGRPIEVRTTAITQLFWMAYTLRDHLWHKRDISTKLAAIRYFEQGRVGLDFAGVSDNWGMATSMFSQQGQSVVLDVRNTIADQIIWLKQEQPAYLLSYPSNIAALAEHCMTHGISLPSLKQVRTLGEKISNDLRPFCKAAWGVEVVDIYSAEEVGYLALQCPGGKHYHVQSEHILLEVLDEKNQPCNPGETGRVVVTTLVNFAKPLIRYAIGDYAEVGQPCECGRGLMTLKSIAGRARNMFMRPDGSKFWPVIPRFQPEVYQKIPVVRQVQYVQKALDAIEVRVGAGGLQYSPEVEASIKQAIQKAWAYPYQVTFSYMDKLPIGSRAKFEDCLSELA